MHTSSAREEEKNFILWVLEEDSKLVNVLHADCSDLLFVDVHCF